MIAQRLKIIFAIRLFAVGLGGLLLSTAAYGHHHHPPPVAMFWGNPAAMGMLPFVGQSLQKTLDDHGNLDAVHNAQDSVNQLGQVQNAIDQASKSGNYDTSNYGALQQALAEATVKALSPKSSEESKSTDLSSPPQNSLNTPTTDAKTSLMDGTLPAPSKEASQSDVKLTSDRNQATSAGTSGSSNTGYTGRVVGTEAGGQIVFVDPSKPQEKSDGNLTKDHADGTAKGQAASTDDLTNLVKKGPSDLAGKPPISNLLAAFGPSNSQLGQKADDQLRVLTESGEGETERDLSSANQGSTAPLSVALVVDHLKGFASRLTELTADGKHLHSLIQLLFLISAGIIALFAYKILRDSRHEARRHALMQFLHRQIQEKQAFKVVASPEQTAKRGTQYIYLNAEKRQWFIATLDPAGKKLVSNAPIAEGSIVSLDRFQGKNKQHVVIGKSGVLTPTAQPERVGVHVKGEDLARFSKTLYSTGR